MQTSIQLKKPSFPRMISNLAQTNQFLKMFSSLTLLMSVLMLVAVMGVSSKGPIVIALSSEGRALTPGAMPKAEDEVSTALLRYLDLRYKWTPANVGSQLQEARNFILPAYTKVFSESVAKVQKFSVDRKVSQRVFSGMPKIDLAKKSASFTGDRITELQGIKAAGDLKLELSFDSGPRTEKNPWGIYVTKEVER